MSDNLTKRGSSPSPAREYRARGGFDDEVHLVLAAPVDVVDSSALRTDCGAAVLEVYTDHRAVTCPNCHSVPTQGH